MKEKLTEDRDGRGGRASCISLFPPRGSDTPSNCVMCRPFKETWIFLIPSLIKITYIKECVRLHQGFHLVYNEVNAETRWLPLQCKWRPNDNLHYLNKVIAITPRYSNEDRCFELSALNPLLRLPNIWRRIDFGIIQGGSSNSMWSKPRTMSRAKSLSAAAAGRGGGSDGGRAPSTHVERPWKSWRSPWIWSVLLAKK